MTERRDGRLLGLDMLEGRRRKEMERKKKVEEKRLMFQERKFAEMMRMAMKEREKEWRKERRSLQQQQQQQQRADRPISAGDSSLAGGRRDDARNRRKSASLEPALDRKASAPKATAPMPCPPRVRGGGGGGDEEDERTSELSLMETMILSSERPLPSPSTSPFTPAYIRTDCLLTPPASNASTFNARGDESNQYFDSGASATSARSSCGTTGSSDQGAPRRKSAYEKTSSFEPEFRAMFFRAASLIRDAIDADVVFLDGDLEGFFESEDCDRSQSCAIAHISTDREAEQATRAERPKSCRRRSGILGYATAGGSSGAWSAGTGSCRHGMVERLGFDVAELSEEALNELVEENAQGRIVAHVDDVPFDRSEPEGSQTDAILRLFLPGAKSIILVPLFDHNRKLFAVCFAWTTSATRTFCGDVEGSFVTAVANCIMAEATRLNILNADKAKGEFISSISHELRTPIHVCF
jgi:hypothetical protein